MAAISSNGTGGGKYSAAASWTGGVKPLITDDVTILSGDVIDCDTAEAALTMTINAGGNLKITTTAGDLTINGVFAQNGTFTMPGSGNTANPAILQLNGIMSCGSGAIWAINGSFDMATGVADNQIIGLGAARWDGVNRADTTGTMRGVRFTGTWNVYVLYRWRNIFANRDTFSYGDLITDGMAAADIDMYSCQVRNFGTILIKGSNYAHTPYYNDYSGTGTVEVRDPAVLTNHDILCNYRDQTKSKIVNSLDIAVNQLKGTYSDSVELTCVESINNPYSVYQSKVLGNASCNLTPQRNTVKSVFYQGSIVTDGNIVVDGTLCTGGIYLFQSPDALTWKYIKVTTPSVILYLTYGSFASFVWTMSRTRTLWLLTHSSVSHYLSVPQFEPIAYDNHAVDNLMTVEHDLDSLAPNYSDMYGLSTGWTAATNSLAAAGELVAATQGWHNTPISGKTGMSVGLLDLSAVTTVITGTLLGSENIRYQISFDGVIWSGQMTEAQLNSNSWTINGETYTPDASRAVQLRTIIINPTGGALTVTSITTTGFKFDPNAVEQTDTERLIELQGESDQILAALSLPLGVTANVYAVKDTEVTDVTDFHGEGGGDVDLTEVLRKVKYNRTEIEKIRDMFEKGLDTIDTAIIKNEIGGPNGRNNNTERGERFHRNWDGQIPFRRLIDELKPRNIDATVNDEP